MNKISKYLFYLIGAVLLLSTSSCRYLYPNQLFKQKDYQFFELAKKKIEEYVISPGDQLTLQVYSRDGFKLVDVLGGNLETRMNQGNSNQGNSSIQNNSIQNQTTYLVDNEGFAKIPILGEMYVKGYTHHELENILSQKFATLFLNPFVILKVSNRRAFVFIGSKATVVALNESPTNLLEVLAKAGGMDRTVKAYKIKLIRGDLSNPQVRMIDLSTLEGLRASDLIIQSNDIIYVEERKRIFLDALQEITPLLSVISLIATSITLAKTLGK